MSRYEPEELGTNRWAIRDHDTGGFVEGFDEAGEPTGQPLEFHAHDPAADWIVRQRYLDEVGPRG